MRISDWSSDVCASYLTKGARTRHNKQTGKMIIRSRHAKKKRSVMARSVWKGPFVDLHLLKKAETAQDGGSSAPIKTWSRWSTLLPQFVGLTFNVYNGRKFVPVSVNKDMVGMKLVEFAPTRFFPGPAADKQGTRYWAKFGRAHV